jgi:hypothetical protein
MTIMHLNWWIKKEPTGQAQKDNRVLINSIDDLQSRFRKLDLKGNRPYKASDDTALNTARTNEIYTQLESHQARAFAILNIPYDQFKKNEH